MTPLIGTIHYSAKHGKFYTTLRNHLPDHGPQVPFHAFLTADTAQGVRQRVVEHIQSGDWVLIESENKSPAYSRR